MEPLKDRVFNTISSTRKDYSPSTIFNYAMIALILTSFAILITETFSSLPQGVKTALTVVDVFITIVFTIEYALRLWTCDKLYPHLGPVKARLKFIVSGWSIIDLLAILPFYALLLIPLDLTALRSLRMLRILRLLKLGRYISALDSVFVVLRNKRHELIASVSAIMVLLLVASVLMYYAENEVQTEIFQDAFSGLWWAVATVTTVGYGDIYPITAAGKLVGSCIALLGIALVAIPTGIISAGFSEVARKNERERHERELQEQKREHEQGKAEVSEHPKP
ncbi:MAG: ion transporter [Coriobacteriales bacterium]|jgi:voltage-gated potassium channel|nr:ion transporter [Coriobacteriales bacterium]